MSFFWNKGWWAQAFPALYKTSQNHPPFMKKTLDHLIPAWDQWAEVFEKSILGIVFYGLFFFWFFGLILIVSFFHESITQFTGTAPFFGLVSLMTLLLTMMGGNMIIGYLSSVLIITDNSLIIEQPSSPFNLKRKILLLEDITALRTEKSWFLGLIFWIGKLIVESAGETVTFFPLDDPNNVLSSIDKSRKLIRKNLQKTPHSI